VNDTFPSCLILYAWIVRVALFAFAADASAWISVTLPGKHFVETRSFSEERTILMSALRLGNIITKILDTSSRSNRELLPQEPASLAFVPRRFSGWPRVHKRAMNSVRSFFSTLRLMHANAPLQTRVHWQVSSVCRQVHRMLAQPRVRVQVLRGPCWTLVGSKATWCTIVLCTGFLLSASKPPLVNREASDADEIIPDEAPLLRYGSLQSDVYKLLRAFLVRVCQTSAMQVASASTCTQQTASKCSDDFSET